MEVHQHKSSGIWVLDSSTFHVQQQQLHTCFLDEWPLPLVTDMTAGVLSGSC